MLLCALPGVPNPLPRYTCLRQVVPNSILVTSNWMLFGLDIRFLVITSMLICSWSKWLWWREFCPGYIFMTYQLIAYVLWTCINWWVQDFENGGIGNVQLHAFDNLSWSQYKKFIPRIAGLQIAPSLRISPEESIQSISKFWKSRIVLKWLVWSPGPPAWTPPHLDIRRCYIELMANSRVVVWSSIIYKFN